MGYPDKDTLPEGAKTYVETWLKEQIFNRTKEFTSKYTERGTETETEAIELAAEHFGWGLVHKNEDHFSNAFLSGTPDLILSDKVVDIKCPWDCFTFPLFDKEIPVKGYDWQLQGYMELAGKEQAELVYCLVNAPESYIEYEARKASKKAGFEDLEMDFYEAFKETMIYDNIPMEYRIKSFSISKSEEKINQIRKRVELCQKYVDFLCIQYKYSEI